MHSIGDSELQDVAATSVVPPVAARAHFPLQRRLVVSTVYNRAMKGIRLHESNEQLFLIIITDCTKSNKLG